MAQLLQEETQVMYCMAMYGHFLTFSKDSRMKQKTKEQLDKIEKIVKHDLSNGKLIQKRLHEQIKSKGICPKELAEELKTISGE